MGEGTGGENQKGGRRRTGTEAFIDPRGVRIFDLFICSCIMNVSYIYVCPKNNETLR